MRDELGGLEGAGGCGMTGFPSTAAFSLTSDLFLFDLQS